MHERDFKEIILDWLGKFLDFILPRSPDVKKLETLTAEEIIKDHLQIERSIKNSTLSLFDYKDRLIRLAVWEIKFRGNQKIARLFAETLGEILSSEFEDKMLFGDFANPILTPIPIGPRRKKERGFNQCELILKNLPENLSGFFEVQTNILEKPSDTAPQTSLSKTERQKNIEGAFHVASDKSVKGRNFIVIDDVTTTGATFREAVRALKAAGAKKVIGAAIAH